MTVGVVYLAVAVAPERVDRREVTVISGTRQRLVHLVHCLTTGESHLEHGRGRGARPPPGTVIPRDDGRSAECQVSSAAEVDLDVLVVLGSFRNKQTDAPIEVHRVRHVGHCEVNTDERDLGTDSRFGHAPMLHVPARPRYVWPDPHTRR